MEIAFDIGKDAANQAKHGLPLAFGVRVLADPRAVHTEDLRHGEHRVNCLGMVNGRVYAATYTMRGTTTRFISVGKANGREQRRYHKAQN